MIGIFFFFDSRCLSFVSSIVSDFCSLIVLSHFHRSVVINFFVFIFFVSFICTGNCSNPSMLEEQADLHFDISKKYIFCYLHISSIITCSFTYFVEMIQKCAGIQMVLSFKIPSKRLCTLP